jgi:EAL domain-containing protein (putative c-di-GMP-specific phosphodiesterase class I)
VSELKIDKSFVEDALDNVQDYMIINSIIQLAHSAKCTVVAEGVENAEQLELMKTMSCDFAQGNFTSPSLSIAELMAFKPK